MLLQIRRRLHRCAENCGEFFPFRCLSFRHTSAKAASRQGRRLQRGAPSWRRRKRRLLNASFSFFSSPIPHSYSRSLAPQMPHTDARSTRSRLRARSSLQLGMAPRCTLDRCKRKNEDRKTAQKEKDAVGGGKRRTRLLLAAALQP